MCEEKEDNIIVSCPHCNEFILIEKLNCCIFRHGVLIRNGLEIDPHSPKEYCEYLFNNKLIYGCGKPFKIIKSDDIFFHAIICDYI